MRFDDDIDKKYIKAVEDALNAIIARGNEDHKQVAEAILDSEMLIKVEPVSWVKASGVTGVISPVSTMMKIRHGEMTFEEALGEVYINIAQETIDGGGQRGCEGTLVHEGRHAYDFATMIQSYSQAELHPLSVFDPTQYELELAAHKTAGDYMLCVDKPDYIDEGLGLMILAQKDATGHCFVSDDGINCRLRDNYGLTQGVKEGPTASKLVGLVLV